MDAGGGGPFAVLAGLRPFMILAFADSGEPQQTVADRPDARVRARVRHPGSLAWRTTDDGTSRCPEERRGHSLP
jgi:hypothetical protein